MAVVGLETLGGEDLRHVARGAATMRDRVLLVRRVQTERAPARRLARGLEQRVVAEAAAPARTERDPAAGGAAPRDDPKTSWRPGLGDREREDAHVAGAPALRREGGELGDELGVVLGVGCVRAGVATRQDARAPAQGLDLKAGVIGEGGQARGPRGEAGLDARVRLERQPVLDRLPGDPEVVERDEVRALQPEQPAELADLVLRARRDDELPGAQRRTVASAAACASNRRASPVSARSRSDSTRLRSNGRPSAVPCSSMYVPASVPTTFMSTSARESSE